MTSKTKKRQKKKYRQFLCSKAGNVLKFLTLTFQTSYNWKIVIIFIIKCNKRVTKNPVRYYKMRRHYKVWQKSYCNGKLKQREIEVAKKFPDKKIKAKAKANHNSVFSFFRSAVHNLLERHKWRLQRRNGRQWITRIFELCWETERNGKISIYLVNKKNIWNALYLLTLKKLFKWPDIWPLWTHVSCKNLEIDAI